MNLKIDKIIVFFLFVFISSNIYAVQWLSNEVFTSTSLGREMYYDAILPAGYDSGRRYPVLIMLHGRNNHYLTWRENSNLLSSMAGRDFIVIMPEGENSWYMGAWLPYIARDLVNYVMKTYRTCNVRGIDGFSMGGYGAFYVAGVGTSSGFKPYRSVCSMSGAFIEPDEAKILDGVKILDRSDLAGNLAPKNCLISFDCGNEDKFKEWIVTYDLAHKNDLMRNDLITAGRILDTDLWYSRPPGKHDWTYWNSRIPDHLAFHHSVFKDYPVLSITSNLESITYISSDAARIAGTASAIGGISNITYKATSGSKVTKGTAVGTNGWYFDATNNVGKTVIRITALSNYGTSCWAEIQLFLRDTSYRIRKVIVKPRKIVAKTSDITYGDGNYLVSEEPTNSFFQVGGYIFYATNGVWKRNNDYVVIYKEKNENRVAKIKFHGKAQKDFILLNIKLKKKNTILPTNFWDVIPVNSDNLIDMEFGKYGEETNLFLDANGKYKYKGTWISK